MEGGGGLVGVGAGGRGVDGCSGGESGAGVALEGGAANNGAGVNNGAGANNGSGVNSGAGVNNGAGANKKCDHAARFEGGSVGIVEGFKSYFLQDDDGQIMETHSISAGLDYSGVGPQIAYLKDEGRLEMKYALDSEVLEAYERLARCEGILPAMESTHGLVEVIKMAPKLNKDEVIVFNCSGRGDKDLFIVAEYFDRAGFGDYLGEWINKNQQ